MNTFENLPASLATGGSAMCHQTEMVNWRHDLFFSHGFFSGELYVAGSTLDAPEWMPSGSVNSTEWRSGTGRPLVRLSTVVRD